MTTETKRPSAAELLRLEAESLLRNDRYIHEFVEALHLCPYAKRCRESGKLHRRVVLRAEDAFDAVRAVEALPVDSVEVALLIFPNAPASGLESARAFEEFAAGLRDRILGAHGGNPPFYCVAFHPDLPRDLLDAHRAVQFIRRSPDPTIQLVRASVLEAVRGPDDGGTRVVDWKKLSLEELMAISSPLSLADRIADANLETLQREGPDRVDAVLQSLRSR
jgi:hypothetical protein